jgi:hypothetical protein
MKQLVQHIQEKLKVSKMNDVMSAGDKYVITEVETGASLAQFDYEDFKRFIDYFFGINNLLEYSKRYENIFEKYEDNVKIDLSDNVNKYFEIVVSILFSQETLEAGIEELNSLRKPNTEVLTLGGALKSSPPTYCKINFIKEFNRILLLIEYDKRS